MQTCRALLRWWRRFASDTSVGRLPHARALLTLGWDKKKMR